MNTFFATLNVNGLNADAKRKIIFNCSKQKKIEIILLQKTHSTVKSRKTMRNGMGKQNRMAAWNKQK